MNQIFDVSGMSCSHCEQAVTRAIRRIDPEAEVRIDLAQGRVEVQSLEPRDAIAHAITEEGYEVAVA